MLFNCLLISVLLSNVLKSLIKVKNVYFAFYVCLLN